MAELFGCSTDNFSLHLKNIYREKELDESATTEDLSVVQFDVDRSVVTRHLQNIFSSNELQEDSVRAIFTHTAEDGKKHLPEGKDGT